MFRDRQDAGEQLAEKLSSLSLRDPIVLAIPRGGIVPAVAIAQRLRADLDVVLAHKLRSPLQPELALGSIGEDGQVFFDQRLQNAFHVSEDYLENERQKQFQELKRRQLLFRSGQPAARVKDRSVILTDDGIATGSTMHAAIEVIRAQKPHELIVAVPVAPPSRIEEIQGRCDRVICLETPYNFMAVGQFYQSFQPVRDSEVVQQLMRHAATAQQ